MDIPFGAETGAETVTRIAPAGARASDITENVAFGAETGAETVGAPLRTLSITTPDQPTVTPALPAGTASLGVGTTTGQQAPTPTEPTLGAFTLRGEPETTAGQTLGLPERARTFEEIVEPVELAEGGGAAALFAGRGLAAEERSRFASQLNARTALRNQSRRDLELASNIEAAAAKANAATTVKDKLAALPTIESTKDVTGAETGLKIGGNPVDPARFEQMKPLIGIAIDETMRRNPGISPAEAQRLAMFDTYRGVLKANTAATGG
jgi:hypothetical protein